MDINALFQPDEKPLDRICPDGGFCRIFRTIACVGDSLASGEFESLNENNERGWHDMYEYSWGQYMARKIGCTVYNFSRGGMSAKWYWDSFGDERDLWNPEKAAQAYIFALGVNDLCGKKMPVGSIEDASRPPEETETFAGYFAAVFNRYREIQPQARFFLMTMPRENRPERDAISEKHAALMYAFAEKYPHTYVLDFYRYAPVYDDTFRKRFFMSGHMNAMGYILTADMTISYIDWIVRQDPEAFKLVPAIAQPWTNVTVTKP